MKNAIFATLAILVFLSCTHTTHRQANPLPLVPTLSPIVVSLHDCENGLYLQPNGPFAVMVFDESALGVHLGVVYYQPITDPGDGAWGITDRFWQDVAWASDAYSLAWGPDGNSLFVSTGEVYGSGCVFRLDLRGRKATRFFPSTDNALKNTSTKIVALDPVKKILSISFPDAQEKEVKESVVKVPFQ